MSVSGTGSFSFCDHFKYSVRSSFQVPCKVAKEKGCSDAAKKVAIAVSTVFLVGFLWHAGSASYNKYKFREEGRLFVHDNDAYIRTHRIDLERNPNILGGWIGCYGIKHAGDRLVLSTVVKSTPSAQTLTVALMYEDNGCIRIANQKYGVAFGDSICSELYDVVLFRDPVQVADYIATKPLVWECEPFKFRGRVPSPALNMGKLNDLFITFPVSPRCPAGRIARKVDDNRGDQTVEILTIDQLKGEYRVKPSVVMKAFIDLWDQKLVQVATLHKAYSELNLH